MKHSIFKTTAVIGIMMALGAGARAQEHVVEAFAEFSSAIATEHNMITMSKNVNYRDKASGTKTGSCSVVEFHLDSHEFQFIRNIINAMDQDRNEAYHNASGQAGSQGVTYAIAYGPGEHDYELIGADNTMNFKVYCFKDPKQEDYRTSYAVEWKQEQDNYYVGKVYCIYGMKPGEAQPTKRQGRVFTLSSDGLSGLGDLSDLGDYSLHIDSLINMSKDLKKLKALGKGLNGNYSFSFSSSGSKHDYDDNDNWLTDFGMLCNSFREKAKSSPKKCAMYATEILKLCKHADDAELTENEEKLCIKQLRQLQKLTDDEFVKGLLDEAITYID